MKVLGISSSLKTNSKSREVLSMFGNKMDHQVEYSQINFDKGNTIDLYCNACDRCNEVSHCIRQPNNHFLDQVKQADVLIFAFPIYYGCISGKSKSILELMYPLKNGELKDKKVIVILSSENAGQEGIAVVEMLPWCFKHACKLLRVDTITSETTLEGKKALISDIQSFIKEENNLEMTISFEDFKYFDKVAGIPIKYNIKEK